MRVQPYERLEVWHRAHNVAVESFHLTASWREWELRSQVRRCAVSVAANIAEGAGSTSRAQFARFLGYALASAAELRYHLRFALDIGLLARERSDALTARVEEVRRMLTGLLRRVRAAPEREPRGARPDRPTDD